MSLEFLDQILRVENEGVQSDSSEPCCICLQDIGRLSSATGVVEYEIRLPCSHRVGSACIATWLGTNNTCPVCRREFFPGQPRPDHDWDLSEDEVVEEAVDEDAATVEEPHSGARISELCDAYCEGLLVSINASHLAWQMADYLHLTVNLRDLRPQVEVSVALYIVTHIMDEHRSLEDISWISGIQVEDIRQAYRRILPIRERLIRPHMLGALTGVCERSLLDSLPLPKTVFIYHGEGGSDLEHRLICADPNRLEELCSQYSYELNYDDDIRYICSVIAGKIRAGLYLAGLSPLPVVAASLYMASHLASRSGTSISQISEVVGISEGTISDAYRSVYPRRRELIDSDMHDMSAEIRVKEALRNMNWPPI